MKKILIILILLLSVSSFFGQTTTKPFYKLTYFSDSLYKISDFGGNVTVEQNPKLEQLMTNFSLAYRNQHQKIFQIQIYFGSGRSGRARAQSIKSVFEAKHPGIPTTLIFEEPYFKVRVGEFSNRIDAERLKAQIADEYDKMFIVEDFEK